tara:strand:+ start:113274 stop:114581 length:1308 start_codon:yes stop_codon:yes gene_type:complete
MNENDLKKYTVILDEGSGVLFQPLDETKTYILSAKHVYYTLVPNESGPDKKELKKSVNYYLSDSQNEPNEIEVINNENYFEHSDENVDAAILILNENLGFNQIFTDERTTDFKDFNLTGYPENKRKANDKYDKQQIRDLNSYSDSLIALRLVVNHLDHEQITGFSGGGIIKTNVDSLLLAGIQSKTPIGNCNGEIEVVPIKRFEEIVDANSLSKLLPSYLSNTKQLINVITSFDQTLPTLKPKLQVALRRQFREVKFELKDIYQSNYISKSSISYSGLKSKQFWVSFLEYALIISLVEEGDFNEELFLQMNKKRKFIYSDSDKDIYDLYSDILLYASDDIDDQCQVLIGTKNLPTTDRTRRMSTFKVPQNIANVDDDETIDRIILRNKIKEIIHLKAIELDCINKNDEFLDQFELDQFENILTEIKRLVYDFFTN